MYVAQIFMDAVINHPIQGVAMIVGILLVGVLCNRRWGTRYLRTKSRVKVWIFAVASLEHSSGLKDAVCSCF